MDVLLTGATGYIGKRFLPVLLNAGHQVHCVVRDVKRFHIPEKYENSVFVYEADLTHEDLKSKLPDSIDIAFFLVHSMSNNKDYSSLEVKMAQNFVEYARSVNIRQIIYLSGICNGNQLSKHLSSRYEVEKILCSSSIPVTTFRAGIIIGSGSASFELIRDLVEKLPIMVAPIWLNTKCQPISIVDVLLFLEKSIGNENVYNRSVDIGGPDVLTYKEMLEGFAKARGLRRKIFIVPVMTPKLSSYWLYFVTSTSFRLACALVDSMKVEVVCRDSNINGELGIDPIGYSEALDRAFGKINEDQVVSSWKDAHTGSGKKSMMVNLPDFHGCLIDERSRDVVSVEKSKNRIWSIGGSTGWYYGNWLWSIRGFIDKLFGGVGLRRGRTSVHKLRPGDALDFWRVVKSNRDSGYLLLYAEMKLPGEAWLEFKLEKNKLTQRAVFRPLGLFGRLYWFILSPFHEFIFRGLINKLAL